MTETRLHIRHLRGSRTCNKNARMWFKDRGWSWQDFLDNGRPVKDFIATGDPLAEPAIAAAEKEARDGRL